jgi:predicted dehydrogenase/acetyltransferase-like isoleucine patch superfamily enzyme
MINPKRKVGVAAVGCGYWGKNLVRNFADLGALVAINDPDPAVATAISQQYQVPSLSWSSILGDPKITGVSIAAPAAHHYRLAKEALAAGKNVFVEKPLALALPEAEELCQQSEALGLVLMVGHLLQYHPAFLRLKKIVRGGALGRLQYIYSNRLNLGKIRREENILWSFAPHDISMILSLVGQEPDHVSAVGGSYLHKTITDVTTTHLSFPGGEQAHVFVSWLHPFKEQKLVVIGDRAMAVFNDGEPWKSKLLFYPHKIEWRESAPVLQRAEAEAIVVEEGEPLRLECGHFIECITRASRPRTDGHEGLRVLRVLSRATESLVRRDVAAAAPAQAVAPPKDRFAGAFVHQSAVIDSPCEIGEGTKIWHFSHVLGRVKIGRDVSIGQNVMVGPDVTVGDRCKIQNNVSIYKGVTLEDGVFCGPSCVFTNVMNPRAEIERKDEFCETLVRRGATIGANATVVCGHTIGAYALIGAGAVVTSDVPDHALMIGVPARRVGWVSHAGEKLGRDLVCPREQRRYVEDGPNQLKELKP